MRLVRTAGVNVCASRVGGKMMTAVHTRLGPPSGFTNLFAACMLAATGSAFSAADSAGQRVSARPVGLAVLDTLWTVGVLQGAPAEEFGDIADAALDSAGNVYLLDKSTHSIRVFDRGGSFIRATGRSGRGPGEFSEPRVIMHDGESTLYVLDSVNGLLKYRTDSAGVHFEQVMKIEVPVTDICFMNGVMFGFGAWEGATIHQISSSGAVVRSFGHLFGPQNHIVQRVLSGEGRIACVPQAGLVIVMSKLLPQVRAYRVNDGSLAWSDSVPNFVQVTIQLDPPGAPAGSYAMWPPAEGNDENRVLQLLDNTRILVQSRRAPSARKLSESGEQPFEIINSCVIEAQTGLCVHRTRTLPLLSALRGDHAVALEQLWFSRAKLLRVGNQ